MSVVLGRLWVHMADNEWSGHRNNNIMPELAKEYADRHKTNWPLVVEVVEHGGWFHVYLFDDDNPGGLRLWTANDAAPLSDAAKKVREKYAGATVVYLGDVRRTVEEAGDSK
jgi:hypothetical protein